LSGRRKENELVVIFCADKSSRPVRQRDGAARLIAAECVVPDGKLAQGTFRRAPRVSSIDAEASLWSRLISGSKTSSNSATKPGIADSITTARNYSPQSSVTNSCCDTTTDANLTTPESNGLSTVSEFPDSLKKDYPHDLLDRLTERGFSIISVNYRLAPKHPFPAATDDVETAIAYVKKHAAALRVDPRRLALLGPSAGGLIVSYVEARHRPENRVAAVVSMFGEHDLVLRAAENPCCMDGRIFPRPSGGCLSSGLAALLGFSEIKTREQEQRLREASAVSFVQRDMPAYLLIHGTRDYGVPFEQSVSMQEKMREAGADCMLIGIVGGGHGSWQNLPQWAKERQRMVRWLLEKTTVH